MACNCATNEQIAKLYERFGENKAKAKTTKGKIKNFFTELGVFLLLIPTSIYIIGYIIYALITNEGKINVTDFFGINRDKNDVYFKQIISN